MFANERMQHFNLLPVMNEKKIFLEKKFNLRRPTRHLKIEFKFSLNTSDGATTFTLRFDP